jgi:serine phosphatase RsbU (regulator of sigma subunit)
VSAALSGTFDVAEALGRLADQVVPAIADWCAVDLVEPQGIRRVAAAHRDPALVATLRAVPPVFEQGMVPAVVGRVIDSGLPVLLEKLDDDVLERIGGPPDRVDMLREVGLTSGLVVPLQASGGVLGTVSLGIADHQRSYDDSDLQLAVEIGGRAGLAVENARLYSREREIAVELRRSMLSVVPGLQISAHQLTGSDRAEVGGDWYDVVPLPDGAVGLAIGDVMGHDLAAAVAMGQLRSVLRSYAWEGHHPADVLDRLDRLVQGLGMAQLATCVFGRLEPVDGGALLRYANAGHLPPVVQQPDGAVRVLDGGRSALVGAPGVGDRGDAGTVIPRGSTLVLYTDGLVENQDPDIEDGIARLCSLLAALDPRLGVDALSDRLLGELVDGPRSDDAAVIAVRITDEWGMN